MMCLKIALFIIAFASLEDNSLLCIENLDCVCNMFNHCIN